MQKTVLIYSNLSLYRRLPFDYLYEFERDKAHQYLCKYYHLQTGNFAEPPPLV